jgi:hypothetical protein
MVKARKQKKPSSQLCPESEGSSSIALEEFNAEVHRK